MSVAQYEVGSTVEGKVTGVKPFGAFIALDDKTQGLVHISEVAHGYVKDIHEVLSVGDEVKVKVKSIDSDSGKISLSIRATQSAPEGGSGDKRSSRNSSGGGRGQKSQGGNKNQGFNTLEDKLKDWLKESNEIHADLNKRARK
ncbi:general stress protein 13 [Geomicrobium halophilum]|uniref:General stress protein 13 n=1 Tax=Geomicrobium halophilum TaxID=549000 RepID=A0A841PMU1_9BACL|nr:S1 domain-containing post-transcriptional regulator GSP13 [Geomicrobium halophilum]MBB6450167.1 general stress protein 13 [Geomicrobium halophilum]